MTKGLKTAQAATYEPSSLDSTPPKEDEHNSSQPKAAAQELKTDDCDLSEAAEGGDYSDDDDNFMRAPEGNPPLEEAKSSTDAKEHEIQMAIRVDNPPEMEGGEEQAPEVHVPITFVSNSEVNMDIARHMKEWKVPACAHWYKHYTTMTQK